MRTVNDGRLNCDTCGRFIPYSQMVDQDGSSGGARFNFTPSSDRSDEELSWTCRQCVEAEKKRQ